MRVGIDDTAGLPDDVLTLTSRQPSPRSIRRPMRVHQFDYDKAATMARLVQALLDCCRAGGFRTPDAAVAARAKHSRSAIWKYFGSAAGLMRHLARNRPVDVVDAIGLSPAARASLTDQDVKRLALVVLTGSPVEVEK